MLYKYKIMKKHLFISLFALIAGQLSAQVSDLGLVAHYSFEDNFENTLSNNYHFQAERESESDMLPYTEDGGVVGKYVRLDQFSALKANYNGIFDGTDSKDYTIAFWFKAEDGAYGGNGTLRTVFELYESLFLRRRTSEIGVASAGLTYNVSIANYVIEGLGWTHVALRYRENPDEDSPNTGVLEYFLNGFHAFTLQTDFYGISQINDYLVLGAGTNGGEMGWSAKGLACDIDELYFFNRALKDSEIAGLSSLNTPQPCPTGNVLISNQEQYDEFVELYPNCEEIAGELLLSGLSTSTDLSAIENIKKINGRLRILNSSSLTSLDGLNIEGEIDGDLSISSCSNLENINGLSKINKINGGLNLSFCSSLENISGLSSLTEIAGNLVISNTGVVSIASLAGLNGEIAGSISISTNPSLTSLAGLHNISSYQTFLQIADNQLLTDLVGLEGLVSGSTGTSFSGLVISNNEGLTSLKGIDNLLSVNEKPIQISNNISLANINGLRNVNPASVSELLIQNNTSLSNCAIEMVCGRLDISTTAVTISGNAEGCETIAEVSTACANPPAPEGDAEQSFCHSGTIADLITDGSNVKWYDEATGGTLLDETESLVNGNSYFASQTITGSESVDRLEVTVTIISPAAPSAEVSQEVCDGSTLADFVVSGSGIRWYDALSGGTLLPSSTEISEGTPYFASRTQQGCESIDRTEVNGIFIVINTNVSQEGVTLTADAENSSFQWVDCNDDNKIVSGANNASFTPAENGNYAVIVTTSGCKDTSDCYAITTLSMDEYAFENKKTLLYPNPAKESFTVLNVPTQSTLYIYDVLGKEVKKVPSSSSTKLKVNVSDLPKGVYVLHIHTLEQNVETIKVVIDK